MRLSLPLIVSFLVFSSSSALPFQSSGPTTLTAAPHLNLPPQSPLMSSSASNNNPSSSLTLSDVLRSTPSISIFASLTRSTTSLTSLLTSSPRTANITILAPSNSALAALPRKPWEQPSDYTTFGASAYEGADGEERAQRNREVFVRAHVVVGELNLDTAQGQGHGERGAEVKKAKTLADTDVWIEERGGEGEGDKRRRVIMPDGVEVQRVAEKVENGEVWILDGVLNYNV